MPGLYCWQTILPPPGRGVKKKKKIAQQTFIDILYGPGARLIEIAAALHGYNLCPSKVKAPQREGCLLLLHLKGEGVSARQETSISCTL